MSNPWVVLGVLFLVRLTLGYQFQTAGSVIPFLVQEHGTSCMLAGALVGAYMLPGLVLAIPAGMAGRHIDEKTAVLAGLSVMMMGGLLGAHAATETELLIARVISGAGATPVFISMTKMIIDRFDHRSLCLAVGLFVLGWPVGIALGQITQPMIAESLAWRAVFISSAIACAFAAVPLAMVRRRPRGMQRRASPIAKNMRLTRRELWSINLAGLIWMCLNAAYVIVISFGPLLMLQHGLRATEAGAFASMASWSFVVAVPFGGYLAQRFSISMSVMVVGLTVAALVAGLLPFATPSYLMFWLFGFAVALATPVVASLPARLLHRDRRSVGLGTYFTWMFAGTAALPVAAGYVTDASQKVAPFMIFAALLLIFCVIGLLILRARAGPLAAQSSGRPGPVAVARSG